MKLKLEDIFEKEYSILTKSGTVAIWLALTALGLKGKKIVVPVNVCFVVVSAIMMSGNDPYFVDIDDNFTLGPDDLSRIDDRRVAAVIFPYMFGNTGDISGAAAVAKRKGWALIEDVAPALGAKVDGKYAGSYTDIAIASFGIGKIIDLKIGGMLCVNSRSLAEEARKLYRGLPQYNDNLNALIYQAYPPLYWQALKDMAEGNERPDFGAMVAHDFKAALISRNDSDHSFYVALEQGLTGLENETAIRVERGKYFQNHIKNEHVTVVPHNAGATYWRQNILVDKERDGLAEYLNSRGVKAQKHFPSMDRLVFKRQGKQYPKSDSVASRIINLWPGKETSFSDIDRMNDLINGYYAWARA